LSGKSTWTIDSMKMIVVKAALTRTGHQEAIGRAGGEGHGG
jgi:hypothetical protein